ncbi:hypothetical protein P7C71_g395, partial [Lecanoromycetidae sp. Uapishka_2]
MTGTPFINDYSDIGTMFNFLRLAPFGNPKWFKRYFFVGKSERRSDILTASCNAVLVLAFFSRAVRRLRSEKFEGFPVTATFEQVNNIVEITLDDNFSSNRTQADVWRERTFMRMACIHSACPSARYTGTESDEEAERIEQDLLDVNMDGQLREEMQAYLHILSQKNEEGASDPVDIKISRQEFKIGIKHREHGYHSSKIDKCLEIIDDRLQSTDKKILVFSTYLTALDVLSVGLEATGVAYLEYNGTVNEKNRAQAERLFQEGDSEIRVMLLTSSSGNLGLTLTMATTVIFLDRSWSPMNDAQCVGRANRIDLDDVLERARDNIQELTVKAFSSTFYQLDNPPPSTAAKAKAEKAKVQAEKAKAKAEKMAEKQAAQQAKARVKAEKRER